ncbi:MAG: HEAT repeat domain-containing protein [Kiritimatiellaeota bacterium]|nr:HEAT repeat domain-containing protein [Kiritimatiellota bacterium]
MKKLFVMMMWLAGVVAASAAPAAQSAPADQQRKLIDLLKSDAPPAAKAITCKQLALYGTKDAVPVLAPLLVDPHLASWARIALEAIPDPAAAEALREALGTLQGQLLVGAINSLGVLRDARAVSGLVEKLNAADADVASAAAEALGRIGGEPAAKALTPLLSGAPAPVRPAVAYGCTLCAEQFLAAGRHADAAKLYDAVRQANVSKQRTIEATRGLILARQSAGIPLLAELLRSPDPKLYHVGLRVARELPGRDVTQALLAELDQAVPERQSYLLLALADRGDAAVLPAALKAAKAGTPGLRLVALSVLERLGGAAALPVLLAIAGEDDADLSQAAKLALTRLTGADVDAAVVAMLKDPDAKTRRLALDLLTRRHIADAVPALLKAAQDSDAQVRLASLKALGNLAGIAELPALLDLLVKLQSPEELQTAESAITALCTRSAKPASGKVVIVKAVYGALPAGPTADVTRKVAARVKRGATTVDASNSAFGDPAGGKVKQLRVDYTLDGQSHHQTVNENETLTLTASSVPPACVDAVCASLPHAPAAPKLALLNILRSLGGPRALVAVRIAATDANAEIKDTALRALCDWPTAEALPDLAQLAQSSPNPTVKILALRGYLRLAGQQAGPAAQQLVLLKDALTMAGRSEEKKLVLAALGSIHNADALALVSSQLGSADLKEEASLAAVTIAEKLPPPRPALVAEVMEQVLKATANEQLARRAKAVAGK